MKLFTPDWYPAFRCIADRCTHSCCIGWEIDIDRDTLAKYQSVSGEWRKRFEENILQNDGTACFRLTQDERCPFLNHKGLCEIILAFGEEAISQICTDHPRFRSFFEGRTEMGLGLCCEEAARLILSHSTPAKLIKLSDDGGPEAETTEEHGFLEWREQLFGIAQDRGLTLTERLAAIAQACHFSYDACKPFVWQSFLLSLERLDDGWTQRVAGMSRYEEETDAQWDVPFEQLLFYLLFRHLSAALEDGLYTERAALCVLLVRVIRSLFLSGGKRSMEELVQICRMASSEIEYSDENVDLLLDKMAEMLKQQH